MVQSIPPKPTVSGTLSLQSGKSATSREAAKAESTGDSVEISTDAVKLLEEGFKKLRAQEVEFMDQRLSALQKEYDILEKLRPIAAFSEKSPIDKALSDLGQRLGKIGADLGRITQRAIAAKQSPGLTFDKPDEAYEEALGKVAQKYEATVKLFIE